MLSGKEDPQVWGNGCECWVTPERMWHTHYGAVEPGSQFEWNPECPKHPDDGYEEPSPEYNFWDDRTHTEEEH